MNNGRILKFYLVSHFPRIFIDFCLFKVSLAILYVYIHISCILYNIWRGFCLHTFFLEKFSEMNRKTSILNLLISECNLFWYWLWYSSFMYSEVLWLLVSDSTKLFCIEFLPIFVGWNNKCAVDSFRIDFLILQLSFYVTSFEDKTSFSETDWLQ